MKIQFSLWYTSSKFVCVRELDGYSTLSALVFTVLVVGASVLRQSRQQETDREGREEGGQLVLIVV